MEFTEREFNFLIKVFSELQAGNPDGNFGNYVKITEYAKLNKKPELLYYYFYHYFEPLLTNDMHFEKSFSNEEKPLMKSIWRKFEVLKESYGELTENDLLAKFGIDLNSLFLDLGIHWKHQSHAH
ncbi:MAG: hypothetical protein ABSD73_11555 [Candidatus Bathyarchaeia archaeon]